MTPPKCALHRGPLGPHDFVPINRIPFVKASTVESPTPVADETLLQPRTYAAGTAWSPKPLGPIPFDELAVRSDDEWTIIVPDRFFYFSPYVL